MTLQDDLGRMVTFYYPPMRVVSLVPSITELLYDLGIKDQIVGKTKYCIHPKIEDDKTTIIGGTKNFDIQKIIDLKPEIVIANKEENTKEGIEELSKFCPVYVTDVRDIDDALNMIENLGKICDKYSKALEIVDKLEIGFDELNREKIGSAIYLIWKQPYMTISKTTFIHSMVELAGFENIFRDKEGNYPEITEEEILESKADYILLSSEPYKFREKHLPKFQSMFPDSKTILVDGETFSWYGSRMLLTTKYFRNLRDSVKK